MALLDTIKTFAEVVGGVIVACTAIWKGFLKKWVTNYRKSVHDRWNRLTVQLGRQDLEIASIKHKLYPNGGSSIDDKQEKMFKRLDEISKSIGHLQTSHRNTWDILEIPSWESDEQGRVTYVSSAACELLGAIPSELMGNSWVGRVAHWDRDEVVKLWRESVANGSEFDYVFSMQRNDGLYQTVQPTVIHNKDKQGKVQNSIGRIFKVGEPYKYEKDI